MDWMRRQDIKEESAETPAVLTPEDADECYFEEDTSIDEGMGRDAESAVASTGSFGYTESLIKGVVSEAKTTARLRCTTAKDERDGRENGRKCRKFWTSDVEIIRELNQTSSKNSPLKIILFESHLSQIIYHFTTKTAWIDLAEEASQKKRST
ncbi:amyloid beta A4 precursor protein-binding family B member 1-interacting protein-like isoform X4 [Vespula squamosa]|uniref:Amyloid beta A4 protein-binding family B member 1-interacting protein-like isoform X4 n=1 Tax=Vespula squamosa TaxID=30214 RepID=A0ABD2BH20_VESSQ